MPHTFFAKNSSGEPHEVVFTLEEDKLTIQCNCQEGALGHICEHKIRLASNDHRMLSNPAQMKDLMEAHLWVIQSPVSDLILRLFDLQGADKRDDRLLQKTENEIAAAMKEGVLIDS